MEEDTLITLEGVVDQASNWTFAGDFQLLQWMKKLSQDLESRAMKTTESLDRLNNNVKCTRAALDNVANSLTALQYGNQFVECRVQDDDDVGHIGNDAPPVNGVDKADKPTSKEMLATFLDNNLKLLRNCHEKYSLDIYDSDEEDGQTEKTCIFQPLNPYNEKPLPHIFGSKEWQANAHVGLTEQQDNCYSGDELSDAFSESSSSAAADNDSYETNSECASSAGNDTFGGHFEVRNAASSLLQSKFANTDPVSESSSTNSSASKIKTFNPLTTGVGVPDRSESTSSTNSKTESLRNKPAVSKATTLGSIPPYSDLFAEPPEDIASTPSSTMSRKAINLFNDDDDEVFKHLAIAGSKRNNPGVVASPKPIVEVTETETKNDPKPKTSLDKATVRGTAKSLLFEELEDKLFNSSALPKHKEYIIQKDDTKKNVTPPAMTPKPRTNLFDDDDDDDDFLSAFVKTQQSRQTTKDLGAPLPHGRSENIFQNSGQPNKNVFADSTNRNTNINLFDGSENVGNFSSVKPAEMSTQKQQHNEDAKPEDRTKQSISRILKSANLFDDEDDDEDEDALFKTKPTMYYSPSNKNIVNEKVVDADSSLPRKSTNLFDDIESLSESVEIKTSSEATEKDKLSHKTITDKSKMDFHKENVSETLPLPRKTTNLFDDFDVLSENVENTFVKDVSKKSAANDKTDLNYIENGNKAYLPLPRKRANLFDGVEELDKKVDVLVKDAVPQQSVDSKSGTNCLKDDTEKSLPLPRKRTSIFEAEILSENVEAKENSEIKTTAMFDDVESSPERVAIEKSISENIDKDPKLISPITNSIMTEPTLDSDDAANNNKKPPSLNDCEPSHLLDKINSVLEDNTMVADDKKNINHEDSLNNTENIASVVQTSVASSRRDSQTSNENIPNNYVEQSSTELDSKKTTLESQTDIPSIPKIYDFNSSLIFDEPPDDNDFFETLGKTSQNPNTKFNSFDLENDLYPEPDLPITPSAADNPSEYKSIHLFSDIPPEDNDFEDVMPQKTEYSKRLNSVFYDDFNETLLAMDRKPDENTYIHTHSVFNNDPPEVDKPIVKKSSSISSKNVTEDKNALIDNVAKPNASSSRPISKLQLPNLNINVQALLPGNIGKPPSHNLVRKQNEESEKDTRAAQPPQENENYVVRTGENEHILPSIHKNRVRAPSNRRPSTRKARQENYRKSLLENEFANTDDNMNKDKRKAVSADIESSKQATRIESNAINNDSLATNIKETQNSTENISNSASIERNVLSSGKNVSKSLHNFLSDDEEDDDNDLFRCIVSKNEPIPKTIHLQNDAPKNAALNLDGSSSIAISNAGLHYPSNSETGPEKSSSNIPVKISETKASSKRIFAESESESDDDFFAKLDSTKHVKKNISTTITKPPLKTAQVSETVGTMKHTSIFSDDSDEDDFLKTTSAKRQAPKSKSKVASHSTSIFSDIDSDDGDLFKANPKAANRNQASSNAASQSQVAAAASTPADVESSQSTKKPIADNPLADLLSL